MKITYKFTTGEVTEIEVSNEMGTVIVDSRRKEENLERKERYHCYSYDIAEFEGKEYADWNTPENITIQDYENSRLADAVSKLSPVQRKRLIMLSDGLSMRDVYAAHSAPTARTFSTTLAVHSAPLANI